MLYEAEPPHSIVSEKLSLERVSILSFLGKGSQGFNDFQLGLLKDCTFPENAEAAATGQGVVIADFSTPIGERPSRARRGSPR